jgi:nucleotide-binding universal stress UspA family protein
MEHKGDRTMSRWLTAEGFEVNIMTKTMEKSEKKIFESKIDLGNKIVKLENILVGTDFSAVSDRALEYAVSLARRYESRIIVAHVVTTDTTETLSPELIVYRGGEVQRAAEESMGGILVSGRLRDVAHETVIEHGLFWPSMEGLIAKHHIDLVVVGTQGTQGVKKILLGSGAEQIFRQAKCPVLTVGPEVTGGTAREVEFKNILFATDFGLGAEREAAYAFSLAQEHQANLTMLHVVRHAEDYSEEGLALKREAIVRELGELVPAGAEMWCKPEFRMRLGEPVEEILEVARETKADLIVVGAKRGKGFAAGHAPRTVAYRVVIGAPCPVLTVRS